ncbi:MAG: YraN family protein [Bacteroidota bacterium]
MAKNKLKGKKAEEIAAEYLAGKGYRILERNWQHIHKEIDIIAEKDKKLVIVEVKARDDGGEVNASEIFSKRKVRNMVDAAEAYIFKENIMMEVRFDFFLVIFDPLGYKVQHIPEAFIPGVNW